MKAGKIKARWRWICLIFIIVLVLIFGVRKFSVQLSKHELKQEIIRLADIAGEEARHTKETITQQIMELEDISRKITRTDMLGENLILDKIESTADVSNFMEIGVSNSQGSAVTGDGKVKNIDSFEFFIRAMEGDNVVCAIPESVDANGEILVMAVPIMHDKEISGVVYGKVKADKVLMNIDLNKSTGKHLVRIVDIDGNYILRSGELPYFSGGNNVYLDLRECEFYDGFNEAKLRGQMSDNKSGYFSYAYNGEKEHVQFRPLGMYDWYVFSITSDEAIRNRVVVTGRITFELCFKVFLCFVLILAVVVFDNKKNSRIMAESNSKLQEFSNILTVVLNKTKDIVFEYSPGTGIIKIYEDPRLEKENTFREAKPEELVNTGVISPEYRSIFMKYIQEDILQDHSELVLKMRHTGEEYIWVKISTTGIYHNLKLENVIGFIRNYSKEKEMEALYENEKKYHNMLIRDALFSCAVNLKEDRVVNTRCSQEW